MSLTNARGRCDLLTLGDQTILDAEMQRQNQSLVAIFSGFEGTS